MGGSCTFLPSCSIEQRARNPSARRKRRMKRVRRLFSHFPSSHLNAGWKSQVLAQIHRSGFYHPVKEISLGLAETIRIEAFGIWIGTPLQSIADEFGGKRRESYSVPAIAC